MIATELHSLVDVLSACIPLCEHEERFIDHWQQNAIDDEARRAFDGDGRLAELPRKRHSCVIGRIAGLQPAHDLDERHDRHGIEEM